MLEARNIVKTFNVGTVNEKKALRGINLTLEDGDFVTVDRRERSREIHLFKCDLRCVAGGQGADHHRGEGYHRSAGA